MEFGKVESLEKVDFSMPKSHRLNQEIVFNDQKKISNSKFYIGGSVWGDKSYLNVVYPKGTKVSEYLSVYTRQFNSIELNSTHYRIPSLQLVEKWREDASPGFKFCPKFPQIISHRFNFIRRNDLTNEFISSIYEFDEHLGLSFLQFPPSFTSKSVFELFSFLNFLPEDFELAIEFRHSSWFEEEVMLMVRDLCLKKKVFLVITDVAGRRDVFHQILTGNKVFVRFVGNDLHSTDKIRIDNWIKRIAEWEQMGVVEFHFFIHQPTKGWASYTIKYFVDALNLSLNLEIKAPQIINEPPPDQQEIKLF